MWQDMGHYWAWRGSGKPTEKPPTEKRIQYATITNGSSMMRLAVTVFEDGVAREINRDELAWHAKHGATVKFHPCNG